MLAWKDKRLCPWSLAWPPLPRFAGALILLFMGGEGGYTIRENGGEVKNIHSIADNREQKSSSAKPVINKMGLLQLHTHYRFPQSAPTHSRKGLGLRVGKQEGDLSPSLHFRFISQEKSGGDVRDQPSTLRQAWGDVPAPSHQGTSAANSPSAEGDVVPGTLCTAGKQGEGREGEERLNRKKITPNPRPLPCRSHQQSYAE